MNYQRKQTKRLNDLRSNEDIKYNHAITHLAGIIMTFVSHYGLFFLQTFTLVIAVLVTLAGIIALSSKNKDEGKIKITPLNDLWAKQKKKCLNIRSIKKR